MPSTSFLPLVTTRLFSVSLCFCFAICLYLYYYLHSTYKQYYSVSAFLRLISLSIIITRYIHVAANDRISSFMAEKYSTVYVYHFFYIHFCLCRLFPSFGSLNSSQFKELQEEIRNSAVNNANK